MQFARPPPSCKKSVGDKIRLREIPFLAKSSELRVEWRESLAEGQSTSVR